jgi:hypothetical protein
MPPVSRLEAAKLALGIARLLYRTRVDRARQAGEPGDPAVLAVGQAGTRLFHCIHAAERQESDRAFVEAAWAIDDLAQLAGPDDLGRVLAVASSIAAGPEAPVAPRPSRRPR